MRAFALAPMTAMIVFTGLSSFFACTQPMNQLDAGTPLAKITTIAGANSANFGFADGDAFTTARFTAPEGLVFDLSGQFLYIADTGNHVIRKLDLMTNLVSTVAGVGTESGSNDTMKQGANVLPAHLKAPRNLVLDENGTGLYFTDTGNYTIRHLNFDTLEVKTLVGAAGVPGFTDGPIANARFGRDVFSPWPGGMVLDTKDSSHPLLYVADSANERIRVIDLVAKEVKTIAGQLRKAGAADGAGVDALFNKPAGLALDGKGKLFVTEANNIDIRQIDLSTNQVTTVAGKAPIDPRHFCENITLKLPPECGANDSAVGTDARFRFPYGVANDNAGGFFAVDSHNNVIRHFNMATFEVTTVAGVQQTVLHDDPIASVDTSPGVNGAFSHPTHVVFVAPNVLYVADRSANCIRRVELVLK